jgi:DNA (cytosine-5)-methyltransferase 1
MVMMLKLGSLFDGSGGFPLAALNVGIWPVWASEIEPFPIRVTTKRLPHVRHYGDVSCLHGDELEPVDIISFGSPCQDLSVAGKRNGLDGSRSSLFFQAVRIIREMRETTDGRYPRYCIWENVPGAFSSNDGEDFRCVIETLCKVKDSSVHVPRPEKWHTAGAVMGDSYSLAWRVLDAQYWGVPQRRKRVFVVTDFAEGGVQLQRYYLSPLACQGILNRCREKGKILPERLRHALEIQSQSTKITLRTADTES